ncbi:Uncharacterized protein APZ42_023199 [Daphnia magna]|uniref:Uncharacterized protein n=1 Tax=Daphnia magna TaxID=35525 RepID=A0A164V537_9CRUS|nr:Uncharacterized protein APZ42_023199 [Daphnia magna]
MFRIHISPPTINYHRLYNDHLLQKESFWQKMTLNVISIVGFSSLSISRSKKRKMAERRKVDMFVRVSSYIQ